MSITHTAGSRKHVFQCWDYLIIIFILRWFIFSMCIIQRFYRVQFSLFCRLIWISRVPFLSLFAIQAIATKYSCPCYSIHNLKQHQIVMTKNRSLEYSVVKVCFGKRVQFRKDPKTLGLISFLKRNLKCNRCWAGTLWPPKIHSRSKANTFRKLGY